MSINQGSETAYIPSPSQRVRDQVALYEATGGAEGGTVEGRPVVILTTTGAKTGGVRKNPVMRVERDGVYAAIASAAGAAQHPQWYRNLLAHPEIRLQDGPALHALRAREISGAEKDAWWAIADALNPNYAKYRAAVMREIPIVLLEPADQSR